MQWLKRLHDDERGLEVIQVVIILAIAAIVLALVKIFWNQIKEFAGNALAQIFDF
jgi:hypothetical protein